MALEEKLNEMWQPAEVLKRIASFVDSEFRNVGNDELTSALENIRDTSRDMHNRDTKKDRLKDFRRLSLIHIIIPLIGVGYEVPSET